MSNLFFRGQRELSTAGVSNTRAAYGPRGPFVRPATLFGNFEAINIYVAKCPEKDAAK